MKTATLPSGTVHKIPDDWQAALIKSDLVAMWNDITPLARNEWICWVDSAKKAETRDRRIAVGVSKLKSGMRRPCCWAGCPHHNPNNLKWQQQPKNKKS